MGALRQLLNFLIVIRKIKIVMGQQHFKHGYTNTEQIIPQNSTVSYHWPVTNLCIWEAQDNQVICFLVAVYMYDLC